MSDENTALKLGIEVDASKAVPVLNEVANATDKVTEAAVKGSEKTVEATKKTVNWHKQAKDALKGLAQTFPELAHVAHLALNPITTSIGAIAAAVAILRNKLADGGRDFEQHKGFDPDYINKSGEAWEAFNTKIEKIKVTAAGVAKELDSILAKNKLIEQLGGKSAQSDEAQIRAQAKAKSGGAANAAIMAENLRRQAAGIKGGTAEQDANTLKKVNEDATKAAAANEEIAKQLELVDAAEAVNEGSSEDNIAGQTVTAFKYGAQFGASSPAAVRATLLQQQSSNQQIINRATQVRKRTETSAAQRTTKKSLLDKAAEFDAEAARLREESNSLQSDADTSKAARIVGSDAGRPSVFRPTGPGAGIVVTDTGRRIGISPSGVGNTITADAYKKLRAGALAIIEFTNQAEREAHAPTTGANVSKTQDATH